MKSNYHTHHYLCTHATGNISDYVKEAIANNFTELGISDHGPINAKAFPRMNLKEFEEIYLKELNEAVLLYGDNIKIYKGLEIEYIKEDDSHYKYLLTKLDYLILGAHYYKGEENLHPYSTYSVNSHERLASYTKYVCEALDKKYFKILAHPDLFMHGYRLLDSFGEKCVKTIVEAAIRNDVLLEFNAGGIRNNKNFDESNNPIYMVPNDGFWKIAATLNPKVIIGSDCHMPNELADDAYHKAFELAESYGLNIVYKLFE